MGKRGKPLSVSRYVTEKRPGHPVAHADGRVRIHRAALYDKIGPGPHPCTWCGMEVDWFLSGRYVLVADHLDRDTWNNDPANLVASCTACNMHRHGRTNPREAATHCRRGHEFTAENTYVRPTGSRLCRICVRARLDTQKV